MKKITFSISLSLIAFVGYMFLTDFRLIKKLVGYNVPARTDVMIEDSSETQQFLKVPEGLKISIAAKELDNPRVMAFDLRDRMLVSETKPGRVGILEDKDNDGDLETKRILIENLRSPHGLDFYLDSQSGITYLYVAETHQVVRYIYDINTGNVVDGSAQNIAFLPDGGRHFTRTIGFGPNFRKEPILKGVVESETLSESKLYISVGSSCDVCEEETWKRAAILESDPEGNFTAEFAGGLRNAVFFTFHPRTKEIWATEMGRDNLGDNLPPDEVNIIRAADRENKIGARRYGWPFCYGNKVQDRSFEPDRFQRADIPTDCSQTESPVIEIPAHSAPLGLAFVSSGAGWPKEWEGDLLVALHGSWNRTEPVGYKIVRYDLNNDGRVLSRDPLDFISGWLKSKNEIFGRPVDLKFHGDSLYITDDSAGMIYRVSPI